MSLLLQIKQDQLQARKDRDIVKAITLTTLIGEAEAVGKNNGNRETTDAETQALIRKFVKNLNETLTVLIKADGADPRIANLNFEMAILNGYLPQTATEEQIREFVSAIITEHAGANRGLIMKVLKTKVEEASLGLDGAVASTIVQQMLS